MLSLCKLTVASADNRVKVETADDSQVLKHGQGSCNVGLTHGQIVLNKRGDGLRDDRLARFTGHGSGGKAASKIRDT